MRCLDHHIFEPSHREGYERCVSCGSWHSTSLKKRELLYENDYWSHDNGRSTLYEQVYNLTEKETNRLSKIESVLWYAQNPGRLLEIGAAPGILIRTAKEMGHDVIGIEPDIKNVLGIKKVTGYDVKIEVGYFPDCIDSLYKPFDYIVAMDVLEHVEDYSSFIRSVYSLLRDGGRFIFMSPILLEDQKLRDRDFKSDEHAWIFSVGFIRDFLQSVGFDILAESRWIVGHEIIVAFKKHSNG